MSSIRLSERHGVNPSVGVCYYCFEENGEVVLPGRLRGDQRSPRRAVWHDQPCEQCCGWMERGVILISVRDDAKHTDRNPYRTGGWTVMSEDYITRVLDEDIATQLLSTRWSFVPDQVWDALGLPRDATPR